MIIMGDLFFIVYMEVLQNKMFHIVSYKMCWKQWDFQQCICLLIKKNRDKPV